MANEAPTEFRAPDAAFTIVSYDGSERHRNGFVVVNESWISKLFAIEDEDRRILGQVEDVILNSGGHVFLAEADGDIVGSAALLFEGNTAAGPIFELGKMGVLESHRRRGIGKALCQQAIRVARDSGASKLYLLGNHTLTPANTMYKSLGFIERPVTDEERKLYKRVSVAMEINFR